MADAKIMTFGELFSATTDVIPDNKAAAVEIEGLDGNDYIKINTTNGSEAVELVSSGVGRVGINQAAPTEQLHISAGSSGAAYVKFTDGTSGHADGEGMHIGLAGSNRMTIWNKEDGIMMFGTNNTEAMRIAADGKVGINDTAPTFTPGWLASDEWLTIKGAAGGALFLERTGSTARKWGVGINTAGAFVVSDDTGSTAPFVIDTAGDVGIGTTAPEATLDINSDGVATGVAQSLWICNSSSAASMTNTRTNIVFKQAAHGVGGRYDAGRIQLGTEGNWTSTGSTRNSFMEFSTISEGSFNPAMRITSAGNVGIGTDDPSVIFEINDTTSGSGNVANVLRPNLADTQSTHVHLGQALSANNSAAFTYTHSSGSAANLGLGFFANGSLVNINESGKVGIGIDDPISRLHIYENNSNTDATLGLTIEQDGTGDALLQFLLTQQQRWIMGIDHSDGDKFKIAETTDLGTDDFFAIDTSGNVVIVGSCSADSFIPTSDERIKENITDAPSQWDDLKAIQFKKYNMINGGEERIGCVAQDLESILPELVATREGVETLHGIKVDGVKGIKQSILVMKAMKALQEALLRIEVLESRLNEGN